MKQRKKSIQSKSNDNVKPNQISVCRVSLLYHTRLKILVTKTEMMLMVNC